MGKSKSGKALSETHWPALVVKHTTGGACNFQRAADELAELVEREAADEVDRLREAMRTAIGVLNAALMKAPDDQRGDC